MANPAKVLGELLANGRDMPEILDGEIIAGDAAEVDVLTNLQQWKQPPTLPFSYVTENQIGRK